MITSLDLMIVLPEILLLSTACVVLVGDLFIDDSRRGLIHSVALAGLAFTLIATLRWMQAGALDIPVEGFAGSFVRDQMADLLKLVALVLSAAILVYAKFYLRQHRLFKGEFYVLILFATLGVMIMASAGNLLMIYLGLELLSLSSYALVAINRDSGAGAESAMKYFVLGAIASGMLLYGMSMLYGLTGTLDLGAISSSLASSEPNALIMALALVFLVVGVAFKLGAVPFHMWLPDVYEGAPTAVVAFLATVPKLGAFAIALRIFEQSLGALATQWEPMLLILAVLSLVVGNVVAIAQTNIKRMLAYSTISHIGFLLLGFLPGTTQGYAAAMFYAIAYTLMTGAAFGVIIAAGHKGQDIEDLTDLAGLNETRPWLAGLMLLAMASLAGFPPLLGFFAKLQVLQAALDAGEVWLAVLAMIFAVIGASYYLRVIKIVYFDSREEPRPVYPASDVMIVVSANALLLLVLGLQSGPLLDACRQAISSALQIPL